MNSFSILRTNVGLTTNIKITIDSNYNLSLNSIDSNYQLSSDKYKNFKFNKESYYDELIHSFYKGLPSSIAFSIMNEKGIDNMSNRFSDQYSDMYSYGARNIIENKDYDEKYEYFAPIYFQNKLPENFIIFRIDGPGIETITKEKFKDLILKNLKVVKNFEIGKKYSTNISHWLHKNFTNNPDFPISPLEIYFENLEFSKWNGIDYENGGYTSKSVFLDEILEKEREIYELEKFIFDNYQNTKTIFPNILNLSFLFDDVPSTPEIERKWSLNRYLGFYVDKLEKVKTMSPYITPELNSDVEILDGNILSSNSDPENPFIENWTEEKPFYVEYKGEYYRVIRYSETRGDEIGVVENDDFVSEEYKKVVVFKYKIISNLDLSGLENEINKNYGIISEDSTLKSINGNFIIESFDNADLWLIEIDGIYHNIIKSDEDTFKINSDYSFKFNENSFEYKVNSISKIKSTVVDNNNLPLKFNIFKLNFTDIKDFDTKIVDTDFSRYEYEKEDQITETSEPKMYFDRYIEEDDITTIDTFVYNNEDVNIPVSSEYTANYETFKIEGDNLSDIWEINPLYCRWGFQNSLSSNDLPYLLNNSTIFEEYNKSPNPFIGTPSRRDRNLDYFYTINSSTSSYVYHSLHIESYDEDKIDIDYKFDLEKYLNGNFDYFTYFFEKPSYFNNKKIKNPSKKYSYFNIGDTSIPNLTLFKGIKFQIYEVDSLISNQRVDNVNVKTSNLFNDYKFSILLTEDPNRMEWKIIDEWDPDKNYLESDIVLFDDMFFQAKSNNNNPINSTDWDFFNNNSSVLWNPNRNYSISGEGKDRIVWNHGEYYYLSNSFNGNDFWNPFANYNENSIVLYRDKYYKSLIDNNNLNPEYEERLNSGLKKSIQSYKNWIEVEKPNITRWEKINFWNPSAQYSENSFVKHLDVVYISNSDVEIGEEPGVSILWDRVYSLVPDNKYVYKPGDNSTIFLNDKYYIIDSNLFNETLNNGINIFINKKWKNVLINIYFNDNTLPKLSNVDRDDIYTELYSILTAKNFIQSLNDLSKKYGFANYINYVIINENSDIDDYNFESNINSLPYIISADTPTGLVMRENSLIKVPIQYNFSTNFKLSKNRIPNISKINYYNNSPISYSIAENKSFDRESRFLQINRFSGYYMPIFTEISIFKGGENGNYLFDTELSIFGISRERKYRKVNRKGSVLKLKDSKRIKSIFPMIDEFGYSFGDYMIFKSNWDNKYYSETFVNNGSFVQDSEEEINLSPNIGQPVVVKLENNKKYLL